jgi:hypothetical protein
MKKEKPPSSPPAPVKIVQVDVPLHQGAITQGYLVLSHISQVQAQYDADGNLQEVRLLFPGGWEGYSLAMGAAAILDAWKAYVQAQQPTK